MANWVQKLMGSLPVNPGMRNGQSKLPVQLREELPNMPTISPEPAIKGLPNASLVYGLAASALFVVSICLLISGAWLNGLLVMLPAICFFGFAVHFIKNG